MSFIKKYFGIDDVNSSVKKEIVGGLVTFLAMVYILPVNTFMLAEAGMNPSAVFAATAIASGLFCIVMGLWAKVPVGLAPGMGMNAFFTYTVVLGMGFTWEEALACVVASGFLFFIITATGARRLLVDAIPIDIKKAITVSIGFFIAFIGLKNAGIIVSDPATYVALGDLTNPTVLLGVFCILVTFVLYIRKVNLAILYGMIITAGVGLALNFIGIPGMPAYSPDTLGSAQDVTQVAGAWREGFTTVITSKAGIVAIITMVFVGFFDATGTYLSVGENAGLLDEKGNVKGSQKALMVDSLAAMFGGMIGTSNLTMFVESNAGIAAGGRTGLMAVVIGLLFLFSLFFYPLMSIVQGIYVESLALTISPVTAGALVLVGAMMMQNIKNINLDDSVILVSVFSCILLTVLSFSIATGIITTFILYVILMLISGRGREVSTTMYVVAPILALFFLI